jgi:hypothetical protein
MVLTSLRATNPKVEWHRRVSGDSELLVPTLSSAAPRRLRLHCATTSNSVLYEIRAASEPMEPPPPAKPNEKVLVRSSFLGQDFLLLRLIAAKTACTQVIDAG